MNEFLVSDWFLIVLIIASLGVGLLLSYPFKEKLRGRKGYIKKYLQEYLNKYSDNIEIELVSNEKLIFEKHITKTVLRKAVLKNDELIFYDRDNRVVVYKLNEVDIKYEISAGKSWCLCKLHINKSESVVSEIYIIIREHLWFTDIIDPFIAFVLFANLVREQKSDEINNLTNEDITSLQNKTIKKN